MQASLPGWSRGTFGSSQGGVELAHVLQEATWLLVLYTLCTCFDTTHDHNPTTQVTLENQVSSDMLLMTVRETLVPQILTTFTLCPGAATAVYAGFTQICILLANGNVSCWGGNTNGELGTGDTLNRIIPTAITGLTGEICA